MKCLAVVITCCCALVSAVAQGTRNVPQRTVFVEYGDKLYADAIIVPTPSGDSAVITVFFRIANDQLTFTTVSDPNEVGGNFKADMRASFELRDGMGVIRQRLPWSSVAYVNTFEETNSKTDYHFGWATMTVAPGEYAITMELVTTKESSQRRLSLPPIKVQKAVQGAGLLAPPIVAEMSKAGDPDVVRPFVNNGNVPFQPQDVVALLMVADTRPRLYDYAIHQEPFGEREIRWWQVSDVQGEVRSEPGVVPSVSSRSTNDRPLITLAARDADPTVALLRVPIPVSALVPAAYRMSIVPRGTTDTIKVTFRVYWEMMPMSLRNVDYAVDILKYITTDEEFESIDDGSDVERRLHVMDYWRKRDPSPTTTFNEHMAEYYRRVDAAFFQYSTLQESDGARSDRGKIFILHGPPTNVRKSLSAGNRATEIWTYSNAVGKTFTFEIDDAGIHRLVGIK